MLLVEDDREVAAMLAELLTSEGYAVDVALDGQQGLHLALSRKHRIMVLDRGLPGIDGLDLLVRLRRAGVTARVLMLTGLGDVTARVEGLNAGADDYLGKPFELDELLARVNALHRRHLEHTDLLPLGGGHLDLQHREVLTSTGEVVGLSARECDLLRTLATAPNTIYRRTDLRTQVFPEATSESIVDTYVHYLRRKLGRESVRTVHGLGYRAGAV
ncbi:response regulator transcription factor [Umezawaea tangerina]|uniref:response regulator transcription factor n=1 Tax=Umezawaea tangerina TaxID=84725 RepID=UPI000D0719EB|nr:response regulator transcription factor [Umezawaea tangerina]